MSIHAERQGGCLVAKRESVRWVLQGEPARDTILTDTLVSKIKMNIYNVNLIEPAPWPKSLPTGRTTPQEHRQWPASAPDAKGVLADGSTLKIAAKSVSEHPALLSAYLQSDPDRRLRTQSGDYTN